ncbi:hypothetical protein F4813DRAFT_258759 [Daldinia decipiens]|uniref:uncharacterized protein n=1 Tax=Daldinia decipiens TaxID=326647 RepID=UPI0020C1E22D|nr:uncharacterized protein F4813DRAFT_258759 [Daldinia decipiens]KAI1653327.1 hypothetical protein F4813DRAFT_258759 [Daldinia decipiens]
MAPTGGQRSGTETRTGSNINSNVSSDQQVAASNSTLNAWVGRRQPSWLTNAKPVKPSPRPPQPPKQPIPTEIVSPIVETTQLVSVPISNAPVTTTTPAPLPQPRRPQPPPEPPLLQTQIQTQQPQTSTSATRTVLPSPAPSDEPSPGATKPQSVPAVAEPRLIQNTTLDDEQQTGARVPTPRLRTILQQNREISVSPRASTPASMSLNTPPTPNLPLPNSNLIPLEDPPAKRQRLGHPALQFLAECRAVTVLNNRLQSIGGVQSLDPAVERPRYQLLLESSESGDLFFIVLHQVFCIWSRNRVQARDICKSYARDPGEMDKGFSSLEMILKSNTKLNPDHINFLAEFPAPLDESLGKTGYKATLGQVLNFLHRIALNWHRVLTDHRAKGYPFLLGELLDEFLLHSPILQGIMFRASRRSIGAGDGPTAERMEMLFKSDQDYHLNYPDDFAMKPQPLRYQAHNESLITAYMSILVSAYQSQGFRVGQQSHPTGSPNIQQSNEHPYQNIQMGSQMGSQTNSQFISHANPQMGGQINPQFNPQASYLANSQIGLQINTQLNRQVHPRVNSPVGYQMNPQMRQNFYQGSLQAPQSTDPALPQGTMPVAIPPSYILSSNANPANSLTVTTPLQPNPNYQRICTPTQSAQFSRIQHQTVRRLSQPDSYMAPASPRPIAPASTGAYGSQPHQVHFTGQRAQSLHRLNSQSGHFHPSHLNPGNQIPDYSNFNSAPNTPTTPQLRYSTNQFQGNQLQGPNYTQSLSDPRLQHKTQFAGHDRDLDRLIPAPGVTIDRRDYPYTQYDRHSVAMSLHQVRLRSPKRMPQEHDPAKLGRYYQAVKEFALPPVAIPPQSYLHEFDFDIPGHQFIQLVKEEAKEGEYLPICLFSSGSLRLRIRCCYMKKMHTSLGDSWVTTETTWPQHIFMELNNKALSIPRRSHFSKDLPIEASSAAVANKNILKISVPKIRENREEPKPCWEFYIAIELVEILSHRDVLRMVRMRGGVPADTTREVIRTRLVGANGFSQQSADEDELIMVNELSIDLMDPFSRVMIKVPVRGKSCTHLECFDLETWLNSRLGKKSCNWCNNVPGGCSKCPNEPSFVDKWKCPLCLADARPYSLVIDEFLVEVRSQLELQNLLQTKSILVSPDGTWKPKEQPADDDGDVDSEDDGNVSTGKLSKTNQLMESGIEVIEID